MTRATLVPLTVVLLLLLLMEHAFYSRGFSTCKRVSVIPPLQTRCDSYILDPHIKSRSTLFSSPDNKETVKSAAVEWSNEQRNDDTERKRKFVIVGGGWAGWGAAKALCQSGTNHSILLIDALPDPTGATPFLSKSGKPVEAGTRGFWKDYPNIYSLCAELRLDEHQIFTPYTKVSFYSPDGLEITTPVFSEATASFPSLPFLSLQRGNDSRAQFPSPLGQVLATVSQFKRLPLQDRVSIVGILLATIDCLGSDESVQEQYDRMTAHDLFLRFKVSKRLVDDFIRPTLLVGLFKPPEELSALVVMELLYYFALAHQDSFDVRWIRNGTVASSLIQPLATRLVEEHGLQVLGACRVGEIALNSTAALTTLYDNHDIPMLPIKSVSYQNKEGDHVVIENVDGVILALGCKGMETVVRKSPSLAKLSVFSKAASLNKGIDVISTRIWFDRVVSTPSPANVFSRFEALRGAGGTFFMLDQLQQGNGDQLWGQTGSNHTNEERTLPKRGSVVACDFYNAGALMSLSDEDLISILTDELLPSAVPKFADAGVVDSWVGRYPSTVSWFSPGSYQARPPLEGAGELLPNVKCAGDWVRMGEREHGAKGLCQERAYVSGIEAANSLLRSFGTTFYSHAVIPVREDEAQFKVGVAVNKLVMQILPRFWVR